MYVCNTKRLQALAFSKNLAIVICPGEGFLDVSAVQIEIVTFFSNIEQLLWKTHAFFHV